MNTIEEKCTECGAKLTGFGGMHFEKNKFFH